MRPERHEYGSWRSDYGPVVIELFQGVMHQHLEPLGHKRLKS
jgi:hypothetical protein